MSTRPTKYNQAFVIFLCLAAVVGGVSALMLVGVLPLHLSAREPGFDQLELLFKLIPFWLAMWIAAAYSKPKASALLGALATSTFVLFVCIYLDS
jgi:hypothetical protein